MAEEIRDLGTPQDLLISNILPTDIQSVDSIAKLNIMTEAQEDLKNNVPQLMLSQTNSNGDVKTWNGDRLNITYASGNDAGYFGITEITGVGSYRGRLNFEFIGANNLFHTVVPGTHSNSFVFSEGNSIADDMNNCNFFHSDYNQFATSGSNNLNFINSNNNTFQLIQDFVIPSASYISLYNSNQNYFKATNNFEGYTVINGSELQNFSLIGSNYNMIVGRTHNEKSTYNPNTTFINTNSGYYKFNENHSSLTFIGNTFGYYNNVNGGNVIGIGEGLMQDGGNEDKILLGFYNQNTTDPNELLVVGDGRLNRDWVEQQIKSKNDWTKDEGTWQTIMATLSGNGSTAFNSTHYRHNIFTVNKNGYITISDYYTPTNSARYGYRGITANVNGTTYEIPFEKLYKQMEADNFVEITEEYVDSLASNIAQKVDELPVMKFNTFTDPVYVRDNENQIQTTAYLNVEKSTNEAAIYAIEELDTYTNNSVFSVSYQPDTFGHPSRNIPAKLVWSYYEPIKSGKPNKVTCSTLIYPYCSKQFILRKPIFTSDTEEKPFSGISIVDGDDKTNSITAESWAPAQESTFYIVRVSREEDKVYYAENTTEKWLYMDYTDGITFTDFINSKITKYATEGDALTQIRAFTEQADYRVEYILG